jgi:hypothetical protein
VAQLPIVKLFVVGALLLFWEQHFCYLSDGGGGGAGGGAAPGDGGAGYQGVVLVLPSTLVAQSCILPTTAEPSFLPTYEPTFGYVT